MVPTISAGKDINDFNAIIEISANGGQIKYEYDKDFQLLTVDRFMPTSMRYPCNYGFVPNTLARDGDPLDVLVLTPVPVQSGTLVRVRGVCVMKMEDESGKDSKVLAVPLTKACCEYKHIQSLQDVSPLLLDIIAHFFAHYKELEPNRWAKFKGWFDKSEAEKEFEASINRFQK
ncbi:inorganic diphosphatase [Coxiella endosymbiont of Amblyomma nuttalli]|uniref:inorganic diphosphatase n=1 Tax=Coxiella endosymbiont of Amblyomma nuttalli TaxID=2749996 RepID=UPI001BAD43F7|nr:inorganic diphosphatase [Coxiella endosymbiont of Amblyomma nuttalli]QTS83718.1 Inorganic pyrophosphatase [Coxiella endosymbiont of Amblyomma nuttalli]